MAGSLSKLSCKLKELSGKLIYQKKHHGRFIKQQIQLEKKQKKDLIAAGQDENSR
jgi:hypothetical protein